MTNIYLFFITLFTSGLLIISYKDFALKKGYTIGSYFQNDSSIIRTLGGLSLLGSVIGSFFYIKWYLVIAGIISCFIISNILTSLLKSYTQILSIILLLLSPLLLLLE